MTYSTSFHRLVIIGELYTDVWNTTVNICNPAGSMSAVTEGFIEDVADTVSDWFETEGEFTSRVILTGIKLNRLDTSGHYADPDTREFTYSAPVYGGTGGNPAPQLTMVSTLLTNTPRGLASKGRMYMPPQAQLLGLGNDGRLTTAQATAVATATTDLIHRLNTVYIPLGASVCVMSKSGAGTTRVVNGVAVGRVPDTMRSRRNTQTEDYQTVLL